MWWYSRSSVSQVDAESGGDWWLPFAFGVSSVWRLPHRFRSVYWLHWEASSVASAAPRIGSRTKDDWRSSSDCAASRPCEVLWGVIRRLHRWHADGVRVKNIPRNHNVGLPRADSTTNGRFKVSEGRIIFMSMYNDVAWDEKGHQERCEHNSLTVADYARKFPRGQWSLSGPWSEKKWYGTYTGRPGGSWDNTAEQMMMNFSESGHPIFRASSAVERGELKSTGGGKSLVTSTGAIRTSSCFSEWSFLRISSVSAEQLQVCATNYLDI